MIMFLTPALRRRALCLLVLLAFLPSSQASFLRIKVTPGCSFTQGRLAVTLALANEGDEAAHDIAAEVSCGATQAVSAVRSLLAAGETCQISVDGLPFPDAHGIYTVGVKLRYMDRRGYPFVTVTTVPLVTALPDTVADPLSASLAPAELARAGHTTLVITNRTAQTIDASIRILVPDELSGPDTNWQLRIPAHSVHREDIALGNRYALRGSRYALAAIVDYMHNGLHRSTVAPSRAHIPLRTSPLQSHRPALLTALCALLALCIVGQLRPSLWRRPASSALGHAAQRAFSPVLILLITSIVLLHLHPAGLLSNTMTVGGDTPAHNYLASQLKQQVTASGRIVGWAPGWWCGFPLFQFYFCLPYLVTALASFVLPFNIAFKLVSVAGILLLPASAYVAARRLRTPFPLPILLSIFMLPLLFDTSHTMWGVNIYSTLAGMIANSLSFSIMLLFIASAARDSDDGRFRLRSVFLFVLLLASHFFTTVIASLTVALLPLLKPRAGFRRAILVLAAEAATGGLLMAWWLVPLVAKRGYGIDFGVNWALDYGTVVSRFMLTVALPLALIALLTALFHQTRRDPAPAPDNPNTAARGPAGATRQFILIHGVMLILAGLLFFFGYSLSPVFVNVRLWPFLTYATLALAAAGCAALLQRVRFVRAGLLAVLAAVLLWGTGTPSEVMRWAEWNYDGLQTKVRWPVFRDLVLPLDGTPGRLANDLHDYNVSFGSSRIFEATPHLIDKPVLEGGLVNSAAGSLFAYYIQSETSDRCAGFPPMVKPTTFNITNATRHLALFNVKHFIARSATTKQALARSPDWRLLRAARGWELYELTTHDGRYVFAPDSAIRAIRTADWKQAALEWIYRPELLDRFFVLLPNASPPPARFADRAQDGSAAEIFDRALGDRSPGSDDVNPAATESPIWDEHISARRIRFKTRAIGSPHIVKCMYYPNWKVRGAEGVYMVTPCFMLVYPTREEVELYYGDTLSDSIGHGLTLVGAALLGVAVYRHVRRRGRRDESV